MGAQEPGISDADLDAMIEAQKMSVENDYAQQWRWIIVMENNKDGMKPPMTIRQPDGHSAVIVFGRTSGRYTLVVADYTGGKKSLVRLLRMRHNVINVQVISDGMAGFDAAKNLPDEITAMRDDMAESAFH